MAAGDVEIIPLSGSTDGKPIVISGNSSGSAVTVHTVSADANVIDLVTLYGFSQAATNLWLTVQWGGTASTDELDITLDYPYTREIVKVIESFPLRNGLVIKAYANVASTGRISGTVHRYHGVAESPNAGSATILPLSGSVDGKIIDFIGHTSTGTSVAVHTATSEANEVDLVTLYFVLQTLPSGTLTMEWGDTTTNENIIQDFDGEHREFFLVAERFPIRNGLPVTAFTAGGGGGLIGYVERVNNG